MKVVIVAGAIMLAAGPVFAADIAVPEAPMVVSDTSVYDWTGGYIGASIGYSSTDSNSAFTNPGLAGVDINNQPTGAIGGIQVGYNFQTGIVVLGIEAEASISNITTSFDDPLSAGDTVTAGSDYSGALLGKIGLGFDRFMPYLVGGVAAAHVYTRDTAPDADDSGIFAGWALGGGVEMALDDNWSVRAQYLHTNLTGPNFNSTHPYESTANPISETVTAGVNYKF